MAAPRAPAISIIMPVYNAVQTVERSVQSLREQTERDWELVAVDDGSTDGTTETLQRLARDDRRIRPVSQSHRGIVAALNNGIDQARAPLLARMDADDESLPRRLEHQRRFLECHPDVGVVSCLVWLTGGEGRNRGYQLYADWLNTMITPEQIMLKRFVESPLAHPTVMFRQRIVHEYGGYRDGDFPEDYELWLRWLDRGVRMAKVDSYLYRWHDTPTRLSRSDPRYRPEAFYRCKADYLAAHLRGNVRKPLLVWGAGRTSRKRARMLLDHGIRLRGYVDIDPRKIGRAMADGAVLAPAELPSPAEAFVLVYVGSRGARPKIRRSLTAKGYVEGRDFLCCA